MPKERSINPVAAQQKADKRKEIAKNKKVVAAQRNEKLARRNPDRIQKQIDELKELETRGTLRAKDQETLAQLERDVKSIQKAREALGDNASKFSSNERRQRQNPRLEQSERRQQLGKRRRDRDEAEDDDTDPDVRVIPMPRDTPPPIPRKGYKDPQVGANGQRVPHALPAKPVAPAPSQIVYTSAPQMRDLKKEATKFVPSAVSQKKRLSKGQGRLLEPEEIDKLEKAGYYAAGKAVEEAELESRFLQTVSETRSEAADVDFDSELQRFEDEMKEHDLSAVGAENMLSRHVQLDDVDDDGD